MRSLLKESWVIMQQRALLCVTTQIKPPSGNWNQPSWDPFIHSFCKHMTSLNVAVLCTVKQDPYRRNQVESIAN